MMSDRLSHRVASDLFHLSASHYLICQILIDIKFFDYILMSRCDAAESPRGKGMIKKGGPHMQKQLRTSASILALLGSIAAIPATAFAQDTYPQSNASDDSEDIVVTGRSREERLQDSPVAVTAIGETSIERANLTRAT